MSAGSLLLFAALLFLAGAILLFMQGRRLAQSEEMTRRLVEEDPARLKRLPSGFQRLLVRAGINLSGCALAGILVFVLVVLLLVSLLSGVLVSLAVLVLGLLFLRLLLDWRFKRRVSQMVSQLPNFLDHVIRSLKSGRSLGDGLLLAMGACPPPLRDALASTRRLMELGLPMDEVLADFAELYPRQEFHILATSVKVNQRYGGNASDLFSNLILLIREREKAAGQLRAMTGETRVAAWVLGGMPLLLLAYSLGTNPGYFLTLWEDAGGKMVLFIALALQVTGCYILYRMLRSVG